jgi:GTP-binding protein Era
LPISAKTGDGVQQLLEVLEKYAQIGPQLFPEDMTTDQPEKQIIAEIIREKLLICMDREIPHGTAVEITKFSERGDEEADAVIIDVDATIYCEKKSQKGGIIGKNGAMLKRIGQLAREDMESFMGAKVFLQTWVKVKENWRDSQSMMRNFGYTKCL